MTLRLLKLSSDLMEQPFERRALRTVEHGPLTFIVVVDEYCNIRNMREMRASVVRVGIGKYPCQDYIVARCLCREGLGLDTEPVDAGTGSRQMRPTGPWSVIFMWKAMPQVIEVAHREPCRIGTLFSIPRCYISRAFYAPLKSLLL